MDKTKFYTAWIKALRSGNYEQGVGNLNKNDEYCCLGVACEVAMNEFDYSLEVTELIDDDGVIYYYNGHRGKLPASLKMAIGLDFEGYLIKMNDNNHNNFNEIADYIEGRCGITSS